jgi:hypothetical protein
LLCERPFDENARAHVDALLSFVEGDAQRKAASAAKALNGEVALLKRLDTNIFAPDSVARVHIGRLEPKLEATIANLVGTATGLCETAIASLEAHEMVNGILDCAEIFTALQSLADRITGKKTR